MITQSVKIYRVNKNDYKFNECNSNLQILNKITQILNKKKPLTAHIKLKDLSHFKERGLQFYLYVHRHKEKSADWSNYFPNILTAVWDFRMQNLSVILFIDNGIDIFIVIGGNAFQQIVTFIDHSFGLKLLSKIIRPNQDQILSINTRGLSGNRAGLSEQYRDQIKVADFAKFGKLPTEAHLTLSPTVSNEFFSFLKSKETDRIKVQVGKSFKIKKNLTFDELKQVIIELGHIMELEEQDYLSSYIQESNYKTISEDLQPLLLQKIFTDFVNKKSQRSNYAQLFDFELCCPDKLIEFYSADRYVLSEKSGKTYKPFDETYDKDEIYTKTLDHCVKKFPGDTEFFDFKAFIQGLRVLAYSDGKKVCSSSFLFHFTSEFKFGPQTVFLVDNKWYRLKYSFLQELKAESLSLLKRNKLSRGIFDIPFKYGMSEFEYNTQYHQSLNHMVFDTITPQGIELCDVLYTGEDATYLIHVKKGFNNKIRELTHQITLASRRLHTDLKSDRKEYLQKNWNAYTKKYTPPSNFDFDHFLQIFEKRIIFVLAFISHRSDNADILYYPGKYQSNIAKYSLIECSRDIREYRYELNIHQIPIQ